MTEKQSSKFLEGKVVKLCGVQMFIKLKHLVFTLCNTMKNHLRAAEKKKNQSSLFILYHFYRLNSPICEFHHSSDAAGKV